MKWAMVILGAGLWIGLATAQTSPPPHGHATATMGVSVTVVEAPKASTSAPPRK